MREIECTPMAHYNNVTKGDILMRCPDDTLCFSAVVRFPHEISCLMAFVPHTFFPNSRGGWGWWRRGDAKACMRK